MKYKLYDYNGNKKEENICDIKEAIREALRQECEVYDEGGDIIFSQWDGWNGDYPNIKNIWFPVADMEMVNKAKRFLTDTDTFYDWCELESDQFSKWIGKEWLHSDRWSVAYDWINDKKFYNTEIPEDIIECLVEYWETNALHLKVGI